MPPTSPHAAPLFAAMHRCAPARPRRESPSRRPGAPAAQGFFVAAAAIAAAAAAAAATTTTTSTTTTTTTTTSTTTTTTTSAALVPLAVLAACSSRYRREPHPPAPGPGLGRRIGWRAHWPPGRQAAPARSAGLLGACARLAGGRPGYYLLPTTTPLLGTARSRGRPGAVPGAAWCGGRVGERTVQGRRMPSLPPLPVPAPVAPVPVPVRRATSSARPPGPLAAPDPLLGLAGLHRRFSTSGGDGGGGGGGGGRSGSSGS